MRLFPARYSGTCSDASDCFGEFEAGDMVGYNQDDELCCRACLVNQRGQIEDRPISSGWGNNIEVRDE